MSWLSSAIGSALTPPGYNAQQQAIRAQRRPQDVANNLITGLQPTLDRQVGFARQMQPFRERSIWDIIRQNSAAGLLEQNDAARRGFTGAAIAQLPMLRQSVSRGGAGIGATQGAEASLFGNATRAGNDHLAWLMGPEGQRMAAMNSLQASGMAMPDLQNLALLASIVNGRPIPPVGQSPIAGLVNAGMTAYGAGAFGGGAH